MVDYKIAKKHAVLSKTDSLGTQEKFHKDGYWYKYNHVGNEGLAEQLVSDVLSCSNVTDYVSYEYCLINGEKGCRSKSFLEDGDQLITFDQLFKNTQIGTITDKIFSMQDVHERIAYLIDFVKDTAGIDCTKYLYETFCIDMLTKNPDRHYKNLALILKQDGTFKTAPIFDNGQALMQNHSITPSYMSLEEKEARVCAATVSGSFDMQYIEMEHIYNGEPLLIDYDKLFRLLDEKYENENEAVQYLKHSLKENEKIFSLQHHLEQKNNLEKDEYSH